MTLSTISRPYDVSTRLLNENSRVAAFTTPLTPTATTHQIASALTRGSARVNAPRSVATSTSAPTTAPHHRLMPMRCTCRLVTARLWSLEAVEWLVSVGGTQAVSVITSAAAAPAEV